MESLKVQPVKTETNKLGDELNISQERREELLNLAQCAIKKTDTWGQVMETVSSIVTNANELAYVCYAFGYKVCQHDGGKGVSNILRELLAS